MLLNEIVDNKGARKPRRRIGRGIGSGRGKTAGKGVKGQKARTGVAIKGFEGGQMPIHRRLPKRGFKNPSAKDFAEISLERLQKAVDGGKLDAAKPVTIAALKAAGLVRHARDGVRLLANGALKTKLTLEVTGASAAAKAAVEKAGGSLTVTILPKAERPVIETKGMKKKKAKAQAKMKTPAAEAAAASE
jgi:large subunit ribosomal protein L15